MLRYISSFKKRIQWLESRIREQEITSGNSPILDKRNISQIDMITCYGDYGINECSDAVTVAPEFSRQPTHTDLRSSTQSRQAHEIGLVSLSSRSEPRGLGPLSDFALANLVFSKSVRSQGRQATKATRVPQFAIQ